MSVYNGARDAPQAVQSILGQTFVDFELIAIDNGSERDNSRQVLQDLSASSGDRRLKLVNLEANIGLAGALNHGIGLARGRYIARQDHDDISHRERLEKQVAYMEAHPACALLGTRAEIWIGDEPTARAHDHSTSNAALQLDLLANNPFVHSSVMLRRSALDEVGLYTLDPTRQPPEDFELWSRIARRFEIANLPERLLIYREVARSMSRDGSNPFLDRMIVICAENLAYWNGLPAPDRYCLDAAALTHAAYDKITADTDIDAVCNVIEKASARIAALDPNMDFSQRTAELVGNVRHHHKYAGTSALWLAARQVPLPTTLKQRIKAWIGR